MPLARGSAGPAAVLLLREKAETGVVFLAASEDGAQQVAVFLSAAAPGRNVLLLPPWDVLPGDDAPPSRAVMGQRMAVLGRLAAAMPERLLLITTREAAEQAIPKREDLNSFTIRIGEAVDLEALQRFCLDTGYILDERVDEPGEAAFRGEVTEVYPAGSTHPFRLQEEDGRVSAIRRYDPLSQRTLAEEDRLTIFPAVEVPGGGNLYDLLPGAAVIEDTGSGDFQPVPDFSRATGDQRLGHFLREQREQGHRIVLLSDDARELSLLSRRAARLLKADVTRARSWSEVAKAPQGALLALPAHLEEGFVADGIAAIAARDVLGSRARSAAGGVPAVAPWQIGMHELAVGDLVVHIDHGVASLAGLEPVETPEKTEAIRLDYAAENKLLVPPEEAHKIWRYGGEESIARDTLHTAAWQKRRLKIERALDETARQLLARAAERSRLEAPLVTPPAAAYERFAARFPYPETRDQRLAIDAVLQDLASGKPMDRLIVGDVGFGKTEVALRAAAAAALSGLQVAVIAPTTVLARQHMRTFERRFAGFGMNIGHLSRLVSPKEARTVKDGLKNGDIRIVIGTHAVLGKTVAFKHLGLVVIDEEHRFGAAQKRKLREAVPGVHLLSLTATPIPRTLQSALAGLQDISTILTPPARRRPIRTTVHPFSGTALQQSLRREKRRGGQSFVVVPRIEDIAPVRDQLGQLVPELTVAAVHGELPPAEADSRFIAFAEGHEDVLLATSIIESGLDVPRANTMLVLRPDLFGLAELHQLRGRVGRGSAQAFCQLMTEQGRELGEIATRRLDAMETLASLGAGLAIASRDLDLRGGGELFGEKQAGHVKLIGLGLYQELLAEALRRMKGEEAKPPRTQIVIDATPLIPEDYIPDVPVRINLYHRISRAADPAEIDQLSDEILDRFGPPPEPVRLMLAMASARAKAALLGIRRIAAGPEGLAFDMDGEAQARALASAAEEDVPLERKKSRLLLPRPCPTPEARLEAVQEVLDSIAQGLAG